MAVYVNNLTRFLDGLHRNRNGGMFEHAILTDQRIEGLAGPATVSFHTLKENARQFGRARRFDSRIGSVHVAETKAINFKHELERARGDQQRIALLREHLAPMFMVTYDFGGSARERHQLIAQALSQANLSTREIKVVPTHVKNIQGIWAFSSRNLATFIWALNEIRANRVRR